MPEIVVNGKAYELNEEGFLARPAEEVAAALAKAEEGIESLTGEHWAIVRFIRQYFLEGCISKREIER